MERHTLAGEYSLPARQLDILAPLSLAIRYPYHPYPTGTSFRLPHKPLIAQPVPALIYTSRSRQPLQVRHVAPALGRTPRPVLMSYAIRGSVFVRFDIFVLLGLIDHNISCRCSSAPSCILPRLSENPLARRHYHRSLRRASYIHSCLRSTTQLIWLVHHLSPRASGPGPYEYLDDTSCSLSPAVRVGMR